MQKRVSRREMGRRLEQGKSAMRVLAAAIVQRGGVMRIHRETYDALPVGHRMSVERDALTGDLILRAEMPTTQHGAQAEAGITFEDIRTRYGTTTSAGDSDDTKKVE